VSSLGNFRWRWKESWWSSQSNNQCPYWLSYCFAAWLSWNSFKLSLVSPFLVISLFPNFNNDEFRFSLGSSSLRDSVQAGKWTGACVSGDGNGINDVATVKGFECLFANIIQIIIPVAGLVFFAMLIIGGFQYLTAGGDPKSFCRHSTLTKSVIA